MRCALKAGNPAPATKELDFARIVDVDFFVPNETELAILAGASVDIEADIDAAAQSLLDRGLKTIIVTMGARGTLLATRSSAKRIEPVQVEPVDTTGAGDAFVGAFARYSVTAGLEEALRMASRYAADNVTRRGTQKAFATLEAFEAFCARLDAAGAA